ncbi:hypothetical protein F4810DRAFT_713837 [Camillea tinctor]|nr:hypothetical protein F4810DRAFT_713837 [Camillea tinctor]
MKRDLRIDPAIINNKHVPKNVTDYTKQQYDRLLEIWDDFVANFSTNKSDPRAVERLEDLKEFVYRICMQIKAGKRPGEDMAFAGIKSYWKRFTAGYARERGLIPTKNMESITNAIDPGGEIGRLFDLKPDSGPRNHATAAVFIWIGEFLWTRDWKIFARPRLRVDLWALLCLSAYTSARVSDNIESTARPNSDTGLYYKHAKLIAFRNEDGETEFSMQTTKFLKARNPESSKLPMPDIHEGRFQEARPLYMNPMLFHLVIFIANGALRDYRGKEGLLKLLDVRLGPDQPKMVISWDRMVLSNPIFSGPSGKILGANAFSKVLRELGIRAGFPDPPSLQCFRSEGLTRIDSDPQYSDTQRLKLAGHGNNDIQRQHYASRNPGIDSQAAYLEARGREVVVADYFLQTEEYKKTESKILALSKRKRCDLDVAGPGESPSDESEIVFHPIRKHRRHLQKLEDEELKDYWKNTSTESFVGSQPYICRGVDRPFSRLRPALPYRQRLADLLLVPAKLRSEEGKNAILALLALYESASEVHRPGLDKSHCSCPKEKKPSHLHVYQCKKRQFPFMEFCFFCNIWLDDRDAWEQDCSRHLKEDSLPQELNWQKVETTFLPGFCPFCLWDSSLTASMRLKPFCSVSEWEAHIRSHNQPWQTACPDGRCHDRFGDADSFYYHMHDIHRIPKRLLIPLAQKDGKRKASDDLGVHQPATRIKTEYKWNNTYL